MGCITSLDNITEEIVAILSSLDIVGVRLQTRDSDSSLDSASSLTAVGGTNGTHYIVSFRGIETTKIAFLLNRNEPKIPFAASSMPADFMNCKVHVDDTVLRVWRISMLKSFNVQLRSTKKRFNNRYYTNPDSKVHGANMGPIWGRHDPGGPHGGPMNFAIWECSRASLKQFGTN